MMNGSNVIGKTEQTIGGRTAALYGGPGAKTVFLQPVDAHDAPHLDGEAEALRALCGHGDWCIAAIPVASWNDALTPWKSLPVFGTEGFGDGASRTLEYLLAHVLPRLDGRKVHLCGYSLAGLFALWGAYQTDAFAGAAAVSPSVWYPGWRAYAAAHSVAVPRVYLSLGEKEETARNRIMASVGDAIRYQYRLLSEAGVACVLQWNPGNHFADSDVRMAKGLAWLMEEPGAAAGRPL